MPRKQHNYHYIYQTTCLITNKYYVGLHSTSNLNDGYLGSGKRLWYSIKKHGKENHKFEILEMLEDRKSLKDREKELVNEERLQDPMCMNLQIGGEGGNNYFINGGPGISVYNSIRNKERNKKHNTIVKPFLGKTHSNDTKKKISNILSGKIFITNDIIFTRINKDDNIPNGWRRGRKIKYSERR